MTPLGAVGMDAFSTTTGISLARPGEGGRTIDRELLRGERPDHRSKEVLLGVSP